MVLELVLAMNRLSRDIGLDLKMAVEAMDLSNPVRLALLREEDEQALELD